MNNWQGWIVALLLLLCAIRIGRSVYSFFRRSEASGNPCDGCLTGCELKELHTEKRSRLGKQKKGKSGKEKKKPKKSCCG